VASHNLMRQPDCQLQELIEFTSLSQKALAFAAAEADLHTYEPWSASSERFDPDLGTSEFPRHHPNGIEPYA
jgi:hypothetical protein